MTTPRFHASVPPNATSVDLAADEAHHLRHVLRLSSGDDVRVFDGAGHEWAGRVGALTRARVVIEALETVPAIVEPRVRVTLCVGLLKGDQMDGVVRDATALGVGVIVPVISEHVAVPKAARQNEAAVARWQRVAVASARQCGRAVVPMVAPPASFRSALDNGKGETLVICVEPAARAARLGVTGTRPASARLFVGPEGGWSAEEVDFAATRFAQPLSLGPRTLRADTAPVVALTTLWAAWGWE